MDRRVTDDDVMSSRTSQSHKRIAQMNCTKQDAVTSKNGNVVATQVCMEDLGLVNLTEICPS